jgi:hypothetical protein
MARVRSTARVTRDGEEAEAAETAPISKVMRQSGLVVSGTIIRGTLKTPKSQLVTPISTKLQRPDGCD